MHNHIAALATRACQRIPPAELYQHRAYSPRSRVRRGMKRGALGAGATLQQLDALLPLLARALASRHAAAASLALRCLCHAVRLPLPGALLYLSGCIACVPVSHCCLA